MASPAGATHQGGFYRFGYDITQLVRPGATTSKSCVTKESSNSSVNRPSVAAITGPSAASIGRYGWKPAADHIAWTAIDARADGSFNAAAASGQSPLRRARNGRARSCWTGGNPAGTAARVRRRSIGDVVTGNSPARRPCGPPRRPNLYRVEFALVRGRPRCTRARTALRLSHARGSAARRRLSQRPQDRAERHQSPQLPPRDRAAP